MAGADPRPVLEFVTLDQAAGELGVSPQGVVLLLGERGLEIRRMERAGRTFSGISRAELELLRAGLDRPLEPGDAADLRERLLAAEVALEEARTDRELAREACERLARVTGQAVAAERQADELRAELGRKEAELAAALALAAGHEARAAQQERALQAERAAAERAIARERRRVKSALAAARAERGALERRLAEEHARREDLRRALRAAHELEAANARFLDRVELKLAAAHHTIAHLRRRTA